MDFDTFKSSFTQPCPYDDPINQAKCPNSESKLREEVQVNLGTNMSEVQYLDGTFKINSTAKPLSHPTTARARKPFVSNPDDPRPISYFEIRIIDVSHRET